MATAPATAPEMKDSVDVGRERGERTWVEKR